MGEAINLVNNFKVEKVIFNCGEYNALEKELNINDNKLYFCRLRNMLMKMTIQMLTI